MPAVVPSIPLLEIRNLSISHRRHLVTNINLVVNAGECVALVGESGSGKTMTAMSIPGLLPHGCNISAGDIFLKGEKIDYQSKKYLRSIRGSKVGVVFQDPMTALNPTMRIGKQIEETLFQNSILSKEQIREKTLHLLERVGIPEPSQRYYSYPFELSGGMRQRVMIAMAIACGPEIVIADEPTTALDVTIQSQILTLLKRLIKEDKMGLLLITHDLGVVASIAYRAYVMQKGSIVEQADVDDLFYHPKHPYTKELLMACQGGIYAS